MEPSKSIFKSKVFWVNVLTAGAAIIAVPEVQSVMPEHALEGLAVVQSIANIALRLFAKPQAVHVLPVK